MWGWGSGNNGQLAQNNITNYLSPVQIPGTQWTKPNASYIFSVAMKTDETLWAWGYGIYGNLAQNNTTEYSSPVQIPGTGWYDTLGGKVYDVFAIKQTT